MDQPQSPPPTIDFLQMLILNGLEDEVLLKIKQHNLKLEIVAGKVVPAGGSMEAWLSKFITNHPVMQIMKDDIRKLSKVQDEVLIVGETGTGKELIARALHGDRPSNKFIAFNCAGVPDTLIEADLFGHTRQAFTGATSDKQGLMKVAGDGTLFLDEIGEMPATVQAKLLRALQEKRIRRLGSTQEEPIECRFVCATNRDIKQMVKDGLFRRDLYARISTFEIDTLPLRDRPDDIIPILESIGGAELIKKCKPADINLSLNVRSLQQHVRRYQVLGKLPI